MGVHQRSQVLSSPAPLACAPLNFRRHDPRRDCAGNLVCHFVLDRENVFERAVITIAPDVMPVGGVDQLRVDADPVPGLRTLPSSTSDAKLAPHMPNVDRFALVGEGRIARDDEQPTQSGQRCDDILGNTIRKILLFGIAAHILEGEHCDRWLAGQCESVVAVVADFSLDPEPVTLPAARYSSALAHRHPRMRRRACRAPAGRHRRICRCRRVGDTFEPAAMLTPSP